MRLLTPILFTALLLLPTLTLAGQPVFPPSVTERPSWSKPFWIDKTIFVIEDNVYVVGVATKALSLEEGRRRSFESAKAELRGRSKALAEAQWQDVATVDLYEEKETDNTFTTYRLIVVKAHGYSPLVLAPSQGDELAKILARIESKKFQAAREAEDKAIREELFLKRHAAARFTAHPSIHLGNLMAFCQKGDKRACETIEDLDVTIARLEVQGYVWNRRTNGYDPIGQRPRS
jgi:hypothetical protein